MDSFGFSCKMKSADEPDFFPEEKTMIKVQKITLIDTSYCYFSYYILSLYRTKRKAENGSVMITTHRIIWFRQTDGLEIPLFHVNTFEKGVSTPTPTLTIFLYREDFSAASIYW